MKKIFIFMFTLVLLATTFISPAAASVDDYDPSVLGRITVTVDVPAGFDEIVYLTLMDNMGAGSSYAVLPEGNYVLVENIPCGVYFVSAYVDNDVMLEYDVFREQDEIIVSRDQDAFINLSVSGGPEEKIPEEETGFDKLPEETGPETTTKPTTKPSSDKNKPSATNPSDFEEIGEKEDATEAPESDASRDQADEGTPLWQQILISLIATAAFVGLIFGIVFIYRRLGDFT